MIRVHPLRDGTMRYAILTALLLIGTPLFAADEPKITPDVVYGHKDGMALTFDVIQLPQRKPPLAS